MKMFQNFPKSIGFIISNEFCERFNYYGLRAILSLYLSYKLNYDESSSIYIFHIFSSLVYFFPLFGSILADGWLGKYRTILYLSVVYAFGGVLLALGAVPVLDIPVKLFTWIGLLLIAIGTGGIKPCVSAFGGDQFHLPQQIKTFAVFFQLFYAAINAGSLLSTLITPILRENVECFGEEDCYSLAFGVPALLMIVSIVIFAAGQRLYVMNEPTGRLNQTFKCIFWAVYKRIKVGNAHPQEHWLDHSISRYGFQLVQEIKVLFKILVLFIPVPMFWALYDQQGSRWTFQATRMDPRIGSLIVKPDQLQFLNPLLIILFIPLFKYIIYPLMKRCELRKPLQRMGIGGVLIMLSFVVAGYIEDKQFEENLGPKDPPPGMSNVILFNGYPCDFKYQLNDQEAVAIRKYSQYSVTVPDHEILRLEWNPVRPRENCETINFSIKDTREGEINTYLVRQSFENVSTRETIIERLDLDFRRPKTLNPDISIVLANLTEISGLRMVNEEEEEVWIDLSSSRLVLNQELPKPGAYKVFINNSTESQDWKFDFAQNSLLIVGVDKANETSIRRIVLVEPFSMSILLLIPQYVLATAGEIMFSITGLEFSYSQAPRSMKSILQACWLLTVAIGNLIVVLVTENRFFENPGHESYLFGLLMLMDILLFVILARMYKPVQFEGDSESEMVYIGGKRPKGVDEDDELNEREIKC